MDGEATKNSVDNFFGIKQTRKPNEDCFQKNMERLYVRKSAPKSKNNNFKKIPSAFLVFSLMFLVYSLNPSEFRPLQVNHERH